MKKSQSRPGTNNFYKRKKTPAAINQEVSLHDKPQTVEKKKTSIFNSSINLTFSLTGDTAMIMSLHSFEINVILSGSVQW